jgi:hypothetical protein
MPDSIVFRRALARGAVVALAALLVGGLAVGCSSNDSGGGGMPAQTPSMAEFTQDPMSIWVGDYAFTESCGADTTSYTMSIHNNGTDYVANIGVTGADADQDVYAAVAGDATKVTLSFSSNAGDATAATYQSGDVLLTLSWSANNLLTTTWGALTPSLPQDANPGAYFVVGAAPDTAGPGYSVCAS